MSWDKSAAEDWPDIIVCHRCRHRVVQGLVARYEHDDCEIEDTTERRRESIRRLHERTARMLRRAGFPGEAPWHEGRAR